VYSCAMEACTAIMRNFLPHARVLARSFNEYHPKGKMTVLVVDGDRAPHGEPFQAVRPWDLGLDRKEVDRVLTLFDGALPAGAFRGALLRHLVHTHDAPVVFLDPDMLVVGSLEEVSRLAGLHGVVLSPHLLDPPRDHQGFAGDRSLLLAGGFNSGLIAAGPRGLNFLDWWATRLQRWTRLAPGEGYYGVQRWLDLVPAMFLHHILRDPGYNVMTMNASERALSKEGTRWLARGHLLRIFHFGGGFDPLQPYLLRPGFAEADALLSENSCLAELHKHYADALVTNGWQEREPLPQPIELQPGLPLDATMREIYGDALMTSERAGTPEPPNPYGSGSAAFVDWLRSPADVRRNACTISRYLHAHWQREDHAREFPDLAGGDAARFLAWARGPLGLAAGVPKSLTTTVVQPTLPVPVSVCGVNLVLHDEGLAGELGECIARELCSIGESVTVLRYGGAAAARPAMSSEPARAAIHDVNILVLNLGDVPHFDYDLGVLFREGRAMVLVVVDSVLRPDEYRVAAQHADEVWCWDELTARRLAEESAARAKAVPIPGALAGDGGRGSDLVCWANLGQSGHSEAVLACVQDYLGNEDPQIEDLHVHVSGCDADLVARETLFGIAAIHECVHLYIGGTWREAVESAHTIVSLGSVVGPLEAAALRRGIRVVNSGHFVDDSQDRHVGAFGQEARRLLASLRSTDRTSPRR
jgi:hypothetical protein